MFTVSRVTPWRYHGGKVLALCMFSVEGGNRWIRLIFIDFFNVELMLWMSFFDFFDRVKICIVFIKIHKILLKGCVLNQDTHRGQTCVYAKIQRPNIKYKSISDLGFCKSSSFYVNPPIRTLRTFQEFKLHGTQPVATGI